MGNKLHNLEQLEQQVCLKHYSFASTATMEGCFRIVGVEPRWLQVRTEPRGLDSR